MFIFSLLGIALILIILWDAFETVVLPRRVTRKVRLARIYYRTLWVLWRKGAKKIQNTSSKEAYLGYFGPLSLLFLLVLWEVGLIIGFALVDFGLQLRFTHLVNHWDFFEYLLASGGAFLPLEFSDLGAIDPAGKILFVIESAIGIGFLAIIIGYFPVQYESFSRRETHINLLDPRAGSPPSTLHLIKNYAGEDNKRSFQTLLENWELWCAELLETHLSYPVLAYYRSQHDNQSWVSALLVMLDVSALVMIGLDGIPRDQAKFTFEMGRHAVTDLGSFFNQKPKKSYKDRLPSADFKKMCTILKQHGIPLTTAKDAEKRLKELRDSYEPHIQILSEFFHMPIQPFLSPPIRETD